MLKAVRMIQGGKAFHGRLTAFPHLSNGQLCITHAVSQHAVVLPLLSSDIVLLLRPLQQLARTGTASFTKGIQTSLTQSGLLQLARTTKDSATMSPCEPA